jgi:hypothetical protein
VSLSAILLTGEYGVEGYGFATIYHKLSSFIQTYRSTCYSTIYTHHKEVPGTGGRYKDRQEGRVGKQSHVRTGGHSLVLFPQGFKLFIEARTSFVCASL